MFWVSSMGKSQNIPLMNAYAIAIQQYNIFLN